MKFFLQRSDRIFKKTYTISTTDLGEIEDLYYATCAKVKDLLKTVTIYMDEGFRAPNFKYFSYDSPGLRHLAPVELWQFRVMLEAHEISLYSKRITEPLNAAVLRKNWRLLNSDGARSITPDFLPGGPEYDGMIHRGQSMSGLDWSPQVQGLQDMRKKPCAMIFGELNEKYNAILLKEKTEKMEKEERRALERARTHKESIRGSSLPGLAEANAERLNACDLIKCGNEPGQSGEKHPFGANNNPLAQLMLAGLATPNTTTFSYALNTVETQLTMLEKMRLEEQEQAEESSKVCRVSTSACTSTKQHEPGSSDHLTAPSSGFGQSRYWQSGLPPSVHPNELIHRPGGNCMPTLLSGDRHSSTRPSSIPRFISAGLGSIFKQDDCPEVVKPQHGYMSCGKLLAAKAYEGRSCAEKQGVTEVKDGKKRASSEVSFGSFKRVARSRSQVSTSVDGLLQLPVQHKSFTLERRH